MDEKAKIRKQEKKRVAEYPRLALGLEDQSIVLTAWKKLINHQVSAGTANHMAYGSNLHQLSADWSGKASVWSLLGRTGSGICPGQNRMQPGVLKHGEYRQ
jgi:hypothetical protein